MPEPPDTPPQSVSGAAPRHDKRYPSPEAGQTELVQYKVSWTTTLGTRSVEASYAVIAASWAVYGTEAMSNGWVKFALTLALLHLGISLLGVIIVVQLIGRRLSFARQNPEKWEAQWNKSGSAASQWPYSQSIDWTSWLYQWVKAILPILAAACLIASFWSSPPANEAQETDASDPAIGEAKGEEPKDQQQAEAFATEQSPTPHAPIDEQRRGRP